MCSSQSTEMADCSEERPSLFDFSHVDSLSYPSSLETSTPSGLSLFNLDASERSSSTEYAFIPIPAFNYPPQIRIPETPSTSFPQDEGYVTPDFEADDHTEDLSPIATSVANDSWPIRSWEALIGCGGQVEKPLLSSYGDADLIEKMMWMKKGDMTNWYPNEPVVIQVPDFVHDIKYLLAGIPSRSFQLNSDTNTFSVTPNIKLQGISTECLCAFAEEFICCGNAAKYLDQLSSNATRVRHGLVYNTLCQTLSVTLQCTRSMVLHLDLSRQSLPAVLYITAPIRSQLVTLSRICRGFDADTPPTGGSIIDRLFVELESVATADGSMLVYSILRPCLTIYFKFLFKWIFKGEIDDPYQEFFIDKKFPHMISNSRNFWTRGFICIDKLLPSFLSDLKDDILACGKSMCLLKTCDPNNRIFRLIDETGVSMDICDSYALLEELRERMNAYYLQCQNELGTRAGFKFTQSSESENLQEKARLAREKNMADYQAKRRKKLHEVADKKYKQLVDLKQQISDLKLQREEEDRLRLEAEREWLEQIKKEQELDMILEQTKQAKIGEFYQSLLEESQKRIALTVWKIKRSKLTEKRANYFREAAESKEISQQNPICEEQSDSLPIPDETPPPEVDLSTTDHGVTAEQSAETDNLIRSFIQQLDSEDTETLPKSAETVAGISPSFLQDNLNLAETSPEFSQNNLNFRAWLDDKDQALRNRVKVLSSGLSDILVDTDFNKKSAENRKMSSRDKNICSTSEKLVQKCEISSDLKNSSDADNSPSSKPESDKSSNTQKNVSQLCPSKSDADNSSPKKDLDQSPNSDSDIDKPCDNSDIFRSSSSKIVTDKSSVPKSDNDKPPSSNSNSLGAGSPKNDIDKSPSSESDINRSNISKSQVDKSNSPKSDIDKSPSLKSTSFTYKSQTDKTESSKSDTDKSLNSRCQTLSELEDERFLNLDNLPLKTDIIDAIFADSVSADRKQTNPYDLTWISSLTVESARIPLRVHTLVANYSLMKHFIDAKLIAHLHLVKSHFLLHDAGFRMTFVGSLGQSLREYRGLNAAQVDWNGMLVEGLSQAKAEEVDPALFLVLGVENAPAVLDITDPEVFDCFSLQYSVEWPLNLIITPDAISRYNTIFKFLLKVQYVDWILMRQFKALKDKRSKYGVQFKQMCLFRHSMTQFIHPLACFISENIIQAEFDHLLAELEKDCHIDSVYYKHVEFVKSLLFNCFLTVKSERLALAFNMLFKNVLQFNEALVQGVWKLDRKAKQLVHSNFEKLELFHRNFITLAGDICEFLRKSTDSGYQLKLNNLTAHLSLSLRS